MRHAQKTIASAISPGTRAHMEVDDVRKAVIFAPVEAVQMIAGGFSKEFVTGGKSELRRAGCQVTPGGGDPEESATEKNRRVRQQCRAR